MVINPQNGIGPTNTGNTRDKTATTGVAAPRGDGDRQKLSGSRDQGRENVFLSERAQTLNRLEAKINAAPDVDSERVAAIKRALVEGNYRINPERIAERMLEQDDLLGS